MRDSCPALSLMLLVPNKAATVRNDMSLAQSIAYFVFSLPPRDRPTDRADLAKRSDQCLEVVEPVAYAVDRICWRHLALTTATSICRDRPVSLRCISNVSS